MPRVRPWRWHLVVLAVFLSEVLLETSGCGASSFILPGAVKVFLVCQRPVSLSALDPTLDSVYSFFDPSLQPYLRRVPIIFSRTAQTTYSFYMGDDLAYVAVSPDFFNTARESEYWANVYSRPPYNMHPDQSIFPEDFRLSLLTHELLHIAQEHLQVDCGEFFAGVEKWYRDDSCGRPVQWRPDLDDGIKPNTTKYRLWWYLYDTPGDPESASDSGWKTMDYCDRYRDFACGIEEFAYIGHTILCPAQAKVRAERLSELSDALIDCYRGIISPDILGLRRVGEGGIAGENP